MIRTYAHSAARTLAEFLGPGNNIGLRFQALRDKSLTEYELDGDQHATFEATLGLDPEDGDGIDWGDDNDDA